jgi:hypothetical protein
VNVTIEDFSPIGAGAGAFLHEYRNAKMISEKVNSFLIFAGLLVRFLFMVL